MTFVTPILVVFAAATNTRTTFELRAVESPADWLLPIGAAVLVAALVARVYRRDTAELGHRYAVLLVAMRLAVLAILLVLYLEPQWRDQQEVTRSSRVVLLVDGSSSMAVRDAGAEAGQATASRSDQVADAFARSDLFDRLSARHDLAVLRFDRVTKPLGSVDRNARGSVRPVASRGAPPGLLAAVSDWQPLLAPSGDETRLGEALVDVLQKESDGPLAGIVVFSDGGQNAGATPEAAVELARDRGIPLYTVGLGSTRPPMNVRVDRLDALPRAFPGDPYAVSGSVQSQGVGLEGRSVTVDLLLRPAEGESSPALRGTGNSVASQTVVLGRSGQSVPVKFEIKPDSKGLKTLVMRIRPPAEDADATDDYRETDVEIADRKDRVLLLAGGPSREYRFLRSVLYRDNSVTVDVLLQSAQQGVSQEAETLLDQFPSTPEKLFAYDCVVAFDPDWQALGIQAVELLEKWVAEHGGGLVAIAGSVYAGKALNGWVQDPAMEAVRSLYPVEFQRQLAVWESGGHASEKPMRLEFGREGSEAEFLLLADSAIESQEVWKRFPGVYHYQPVRAAKAAATVFARLEASGGAKPIYLAGHYYGSGQVFFLASGEMWRLRSGNEEHFGRFYTKLIRHVAQGRLLRQSPRGVLLVGQERYVLGSTVDLRAQLLDGQLRPLTVSEVSVDATLPDGRIRPVVLRADATRDGAYVGQMTATAEGTYRLELAVPQSSERIGRRFQVALAELERQRIEQNDKLLMQIARDSGGKYFNGMAAAIDINAPGPLVPLLKDRTRTDVIPGTPQRLWDMPWIGYLLTAILGLLFAEWTLRRLLKLA